MANWDVTFEAFPLGSTQPSQIDDAIRELKEELRLRVAKELIWELGSPAATQQGWLRAGASRMYVGATAPITRPDTTTSLTAQDNGRLWYDTTNTALKRYVHPDWVTVIITPNQSLKTTDDVEFNDLTVNDAAVGGNLTVTGTADVTGVLKKGLNNPDLQGGGRAVGFYTGANASLTDYPIGSVIMVRTGSSSYRPVRNELISVFIRFTSDGLGFRFNGFDVPGETLSGQWRVRGETDDATAGRVIYLTQRVS